MQRGAGRTGGRRYRRLPRGLTGVALWGLRGRRPDGAAIGAVPATGPSIAAYTVLDGLGVRASGAPLGHVARLMVVAGLAVPAYAVRRGRTTATLRPFAAPGLLGAALSVAAHGLVPWARTKAELAPVAPPRKPSVVVGAAIGAVFFEERFGAPRIAAAGPLVGGVAPMPHAGQSPERACPPAPPLSAGPRHPTDRARTCCCGR